MSRANLLLFTTLFCIVYVTVYALKITVFLFYPQIGRVTFAPLPPNAGPAMLYYGWVTAALVGGVLGLLVPERWARRIPASLSWAAPIGSLCYVIYHERGWLFP